jgi:hydrogenase-4 component F
MTILLFALLLVPPFTAVACRFSRDLHRVERFNVAGAAITAGLSFAVVAHVATHGPLIAFRHQIYVDALSAIMLGTIATLGVAAAIISPRYLRHDLAAGHVPDGRQGARWYFFGLHVFLWTMIVTVLVNNLGLLWVGIEATTLASALLVGFYRTQAALEAAWKYLILCTVGITCALFGVLLTYYAARQGGDTASLNWSTLSQAGTRLDPALMRLAFAFILVGFGAKAGFAPLHTWLADAHSQAPSPVSGLLSGILLSCSLFGILRFQALANHATGTQFAGNLLIAAGVLSVAVATPFMLIQRDLKRLLAYSSVEHMGLMAIAFGIGSPLAATAGLLHVVCHAATKSFLFFLAGDLLQRFGTRRISAIRGALRTSPLTGWGFFMGIFAISGLPPSGIFVSEVGMLSAALADRWLALAAAITTVALLGVIFGSLLSHALRILYEGMNGLGTNSPVPFPRSPYRIDLALAVSTVPLAAVTVLFGLHVPAGVARLINDAIATLAIAPR